MIMKKRHAYNLAILLAAGSIMISACGKKTDVPADKTVPAQTESQTETSAEGTSSPEESSSETQVPEDTESSKFYMLQGTITKTEKNDSAFTLLADDGKEYKIALSDIHDVETEIEKNTQIAIACMKDPSYRRWQSGCSFQSLFLHHEYQKEQSYTLFRRQPVR